MTTYNIESITGRGILSALQVTGHKVATLLASYGEANLWELPCGERVIEVGGDAVFSGMDAKRFLALCAEYGIREDGKYSVAYFVRCFVAVMGSEPSEARMARFAMVAGNVN